MKARKYLKARRAFTLAEMVVVMAVMSIMMLMVTTFTILCNAWSNWGVNRYNLTRSERSAETILRQYVSCYDNSNYYFVPSEDRTALLATSIADPQQHFTLSYDGDGLMSFDRAGDQRSICEVEHIKSVHFVVYNNDRHQQLIIMTLSYELPDIGVGTRDDKGEYDVFVCTRATGAKA